MTRGKSDVTARDLDVITAELNIRLMHLARFLDGVDFTPTADIPKLDVEQSGFPGIRRNNKSTLGNAAGPIRNLTQWIERAGIVVGFSKFGGASLGGVTFRATGRPPLILLNTLHPRGYGCALPWPTSLAIWLCIDSDGDDGRRSERIASSLLMPRSRSVQPFGGANNT